MPTTLVQEKQVFERVVVSREEALSMFLENKFKVKGPIHLFFSDCWLFPDCSLIVGHPDSWHALAPNTSVTNRTSYTENLLYMGCAQVELITNLPETSVISLYRNGPMVDLCCGPHVPNTGYLKVRPKTLSKS
jgi:threonyl-tRNA synthetase